MRSFSLPHTQPGDRHMTPQRITRRAAIRTAVTTVAGLAGCNRKRPGPTVPETPYGDNPQSPFVGSVVTTGTGPGPRSRHCLAHDRGGEGHRAVWRHGLGPARFDRRGLLGAAPGAVGQGRTS